MPQLSVQANIRYIVLLNAAVDSSALTIGSPTLLGLFYTDVVE
jgi:hypothetical protein